MTSRFFYCMALACVFSFSAQAQPVISNCERLTIGSSVTFQPCLTTNVSPGDSGANVTWDFSDLTAQQYTASEQVVSPAATAWQAYYPNATEAIINHDTTDIQYLRITSDSILSLSELYMGTDSTVDVHTIPHLSATNPITYGDNIQDSFTIDYTSRILDPNNNPGYISYQGYGIITMKADAYGTLILPNNSYSNVIRLKIQERQHRPITGDQTITKYLWYDNSHASALLSIWFVTPGSTTTPESVQYLESEILNVPGVTQTNFSFYPNPAIGTIHIAPCATGTISLINVLGQTQTTVNVDEHGATIPVQQYSPGLYFLSYHTLTNNKTYQVIILH